MALPRSSHWGPALAHQRKRPAGSVGERRRFHWSATVPDLISIGRQVGLPSRGTICGTDPLHAPPCPLHHGQGAPSPSTRRVHLKRCSGSSGVRGVGALGAFDGVPGRAPVPGLGICLRVAYVHVRDVIQWTVSNAAEHDVRTQNGAIDGLALPCKQVVPGSSPGVGSVSSQVRDR